MKKLLLLLLITSCASGPTTRNHKYIWDRNEEDLNKYFMTFDKELVQLVRKEVDSQLPIGKYVYTGAYAKDFLVGEKVLLKSVDFQKEDPDKGLFEKDYNNRSNIRGLKTPKMPYTYDQVTKGNPIDNFDYYVTLDLELSGIKYPITYGVNFICGGVQCRETKLTPFFDRDVNYSNSTAYNMNRNIVGMYFDWKPQLSGVKLTALDDDKRLFHNNDILKEFSDANVRRSIRHRLIYRGMPVKAALYAVGTGQNMGVIPYGQGLEGPVTNVKYELHKRTYKRGND